MQTIDPVAAMHRANQAFHEQLLETAPLSCGGAYFSARYGALANQVREVKIAADTSMEQAYAQVQSFFAGLSHPCRMWSPAPGMPVEHIEKIDRFLGAKGYLARRKTIMALVPWPELPPRPPLRVVPGRAVRAGLYELLLNDPGRGPPELRTLSSDMFMARLDDPQFEVWTALAGTTPVGHVCLLQVGPIAAVYDLYVRREHRRQGYGLALMHDIITTARRLELRTVVLEVGESNAEAIHLYDRCGFQGIAAGVDFFAPSPEKYA